MKHATSLIYKIIITLLTTSIALAGCSLFDTGEKELPPNIQAPVTTLDTLVIVEGNITPREDAGLFFTYGGIVAEVLVEEGQQVSKGDLLMRLGDRESLQASLAAANLELTTAQQEYDDLIDKAGLAYGQSLGDLAGAEQALTQAKQELADLDTDDYQDDIDDAKNDITEAKEDLDDAQEEYEKYKDLDRDNSKRKNAEDDLEEAQDDYDQAVRDLDMLLNDLAQARAMVTLSQARVDDLRQEVEDA